MSKTTQGSFITLNGEEFYKISNYDCMEDFFMTMISASDIWNFCWSQGGLTAGRIDCDHAVFPYYTADKVKDAKSYTGPHTVITVKSSTSTENWKPFEEIDSSLLDSNNFERNLYKNVSGTKIIFEEINKKLNLAFRYCWTSSAKFGLVRKVSVENLSSSSVEVTVLDGCKNILPACVTADFQNNNSVLLDAYKKTELDTESNLAIFTVSSIVTDKAEPNEGLYANTCWFNTKDTPILDLDEKAATISRGKRPACFIEKNIKLNGNACETWYQVFDTYLDSCRVADLTAKLADKVALTKELEEDIENGTKAIMTRIAEADGIQETAEKSTTIHHSANVLFNIMRGGIFANGGKIDVEDFVNSTAVRNKAGAKELASLLQSKGISGLVDYSTLKDAIFTDDGCPQAKRLFLEYMPLTFSRRHGDPSRPWNRFAIKIQNPDGSQVLNYEGNWRDIFQNWEALVWSYPEYIENMCAKFLNAMTIDGFNPYRITRQGIDWEVPEPDNPWAQIGYWGDHQVIYFEKLLEFCLKTKKQEFLDGLNEAIYASSNVPYRIADYDAIIKDPRNTITFDYKLNSELLEKTKVYGTDGKLIADKDGNPYLVSITAKMLQIVIGKISNLVPGGGIWLNTQRPEWNDANNALAGYGLSVVTTCYLQRFLKELILIYESAKQTSFTLPVEIASCFTNLGKVFAKFDAEKTAKDSSLRFDFTKEAGLIFEEERKSFYENGYKGENAEISKDDLVAILKSMQKAVEVTIKENKRKDGLYHAYNTMKITDSTMEISYLTEMLEGQVAVLSSGLLSGEEVLALTKALKASKLFEPRQYSYLLYPDKDLPTFRNKNSISATIAVKELANKVGSDFLKLDSRGFYHFNADFRNARVLEEYIDSLENKPAKEDVKALLELYESTFNHQNFTGRSGTFFAYEGLGSIYWHMVSKLLLAIQEAALEAAKGDNKELTASLTEAYYDVRKGIGFNKTPELYGAFPQDPYSHTPKNQGAKQPGMTGQVKEEVLTRFGELGVILEDSTATFAPTILKSSEFIKDGHKSYLKFTWCGVPVEYNLVEKGNESITVVSSTGTAERKGTSLTKEETALLFKRNGNIKQINVSLSL